jgi:hypothetical protein
MSRVTTPTGNGEPPIGVSAPVLESNANPARASVGFDGNGLGKRPPRRSGKRLGFEAAPPAMSLVRMDPLTPEGTLPKMTGAETIIEKAK